MAARLLLGFFGLAFLLLGVEFVLFPQALTAQTFFVLFATEILGLAGAIWLLRRQQIW